MIDSVVPRRAAQSLIFCCSCQSSQSMLHRTLGQIAGATKSSGYAVFNYPVSPRKLEKPIGPYDKFPAKDMEPEVLKHFTSVELVGGDKSVPLWKAIGPK